MTEEPRPDALPALQRPTGPEHFDPLYSDTPPWDIGRPQAVFLALATAGQLRGRVLDVGCGTGEHALMAAGLGLDATGIDGAPTAIAAAQRKARERGLLAEFLVWNALDLPSLGRQFDTVLDCGLFHVFDDRARPRFVESLRAAMPPGGTYHMLCFSEHQPGELGPRRLRQEEIRASFRDGWHVESIKAARLETRAQPDGALAWYAVIGRG
jgi:cyclopropane fatty-acyl-phospholipid synthase-like methyltransferase